MMESQITREAAWDRCGLLFCNNGSLYYYIRHIFPTKYIIINYKSSVLRYF